jgi:galactonate dehydratase
VKAVRAVIGPKRDLLVDAHSHFDRERGVALARALERLNLYWLEEVTKPPDLPAINEAARMPTAGGEAIYGVQGFLPYVQARAVDILMPDVKYCGGMLELKKIAALGEAAGMKIAPHGPASPVGNIAAAQVCAAIPNFQILEFAFGEAPWRAELVNPPEELKNGVWTMSERPGLGVDWNETILRRQALTA